MNEKLLEAQIKAAEVDIAWAQHDGDVFGELEATRRLRMLAAFNRPDDPFWKEQANKLAIKCRAIVLDYPVWLAFVEAPPEDWFDAQTWMQIYERWQRLYQALQRCEERPITTAWLLDRFGYTA